MKDEKIIEIVEWCGRNDVKLMGILGGEPFCRKELCLNVMEKIKEYEMEGSITTNGTLLDEEDIRRIVEMQWDLMRFSVDGLEKTHDFLRGKKGCFRTVYEVMRNMKEVKEELGSCKPSMEINMVLCRSNYKEVKDVVKLASDTGCEAVLILPMIELTEECKALKIEKNEQVIHELKEASDLAKRFGIRTNIDYVVETQAVYEDDKSKIIKEESEGKIPCFLPWYSMNIDAVGNVTPCCNMQPIGDNVKEKCLEDIWFGEKFDRIRDNMGEGKLPKECARCCLPLMEENNILRRMV